MGDAIISIVDLQALISNSFFSGNTTAAALVIFSVVMLGILGLIKRPFLALVAMIPITVLFQQIGILPTDLAIIMIVIAVLALGVTSSKALR